jgi:receptor protein-tyrosine kinase/non-specific protein-tyrosine kinase
MNEPSQTTLADYLRTLRQYRWFIIFVGLLCGGAALAFSLVQEKKYEATSAVNVTDPSQDPSIGASGFTAQTPLQLASAHAPTVTRSAVVQKVKRQLGVRENVDQIRSLVSVEIDPNSYLVLITANSSDANEAADLANAFAQADADLSTEAVQAEFKAEANQLAAELKEVRGSSPINQGIDYNRLSLLRSLSEVAQPVKVSDVAEVPGSPASPKPVRNAVAAGIFGLLLGIGLAYGRQMLNRKLRDPSQVDEIFERPIVARLRSDAFGHTGSAQDAQVKGIGPLDPLDAEAFRMLRENVRYLAIDHDLRTIAVTSAVPEEGKSTVAACLAMAYAAAGKQTLLVECDLRRRVLAGRFGLDEAPGLSDYLLGHAEPQDILQVVPVPTAPTTNGSPRTLVCITAGSAPPHPADILSSKRFAEFLSVVGKTYDQVIIDCPPLLPVADTLEIVPRAEGVLMCVRLDWTTRDQAQAARAALDRLPERPLGLVLTAFKELGKDYYRGYYHYRDERPAEPART